MEEPSPLNSKSLRRSGMQKTNWWSMSGTMSARTFSLPAREFAGSRPPGPARANSFFLPWVCNRGLFPLGWSWSAQKNPGGNERRRTLEALAIVVTSVHDLMAGFLARPQERKSTLSGAGRRSSSAIDWEISSKTPLSWRMAASSPYPDSVST